jgi:hypothetical protein
MTKLNVKVFVFFFKFKINIYIAGKGTNHYLGWNKIFKSRIGFLKMDILKMSKIENLNKVSKNKNGFLNCDENALKIIFLLKKCVTITFYKVPRN